MQAVWLFTINNFLLFAPIFVNLYGVIDYRSGKLYFAVSLFNINLLGGYCTINGVKVYIHYFNKKVYILDLYDYIFKNKRSFKLVGAEIYKVKTQTRCCYKNCTFACILGALSILNKGIISKVYFKKNFIKINNEFVLVEKNEFATFFNVGVFFNFFSITNVLLKGIIKKVVKNIGRKK